MSSFMRSDASVFFDELLLIYHSDSSYAERYLELRKILQELLKEVLVQQKIQFPDLYSRLTYAIELLHFMPLEKKNIQTMRKNAHLVILDQLEPTHEMFCQDWSALAITIGKMTQVDMPKSVQSIHLKHVERTSQDLPIMMQDERVDLVRFLVKDVQGGVIRGYADQLTSDLYQLIYDAETSLFKMSLKLVEPGHVLHLVDCQVKGQEIEPQLVILEPDFLVDISAIAECFKSYGTHPYNYFIQKLSPRQMTTPILIGNMANHFLDIFVHQSHGRQMTFRDAMREIFKMYPFDISVNSDLDDDENSKNFFKESERQFNHIAHVVQEVLPQQGIRIENTILEPSFLCTQLGIQGRLDFLNIHQDKTVVIELKSGKAPFPDTRTDLVGENHRAQLFLYQIVIQKNLGIRFQDITSYLLYSKYSEPDSNLRMVRPFMDSIKEILDLRNQVVFIERKIAEDASYFSKIVNHISPDVIINKEGQNERFLNTYIIPQIHAFKMPFNVCSDLERAYFYNFYSFVTREMYIAKSGVSYYDYSLGHAGTWLQDLEAKLEAGEILVDLKITQNLADQVRPIVSLEIPPYSESFLPNFRNGDIVILYQRNKASDQVSNKQIFRGTIIKISHQEVVVLLRSTQNNIQVLPNDKLYALEHDFMESSYGGMYRGLYAFLIANQDRRDLLLNQRPLEIDEEVELLTEIENPSVRELVLNAKKARDYYLLLGPPGTGKTSIALKSMVKEFYADSEMNILLLSYTNRAVDEICEAISSLEPVIDYVRVGSEYSTDERFHDRLLQNVIKDHTKRAEVKETLSQYRVFVGTVASMSGRAALFRMKKFEVAIIDEASQILEPQLLGILSAKHGSNQNAIGKFIMIGDHKQLPAIVVQSQEASQIVDADLAQIGITDARVSLFERLFRYHQNDANSPHWSMLKKQGRMHPTIAEFVNQNFYQSQLEVVPVIHQQEPLAWVNYDEQNPWERVVAKQRVAFYNSVHSDTDKSFKINSVEAQTCAQLVASIYQLYEKNNLPFTPNQSIGIITPYRNQIALIKKKILQLGIPELEEITVDTVERYQGSQRDIIIYSFCVNHRSQLALLTNTFVEDGQVIDRKLNVALTRARKQMFLTGSPYYLRQNELFSQLIDYVEEHGIVVGLESK